ncbi:phage tail tip lysozyme, partial [Akkermansiaceae bacterium]|nr:phage tail tip lysozyme [Akkermansiaceae bacterium]
MDFQSTSAQLVKDLMRDFGLTEFQAAGLVGNLAYESGNFKQLQEKEPLIPGSKGGYGFAQWTGVRRDGF